MATISAFSRPFMAKFYLFAFLIISYSLRTTVLRTPRKQQIGDKLHRETDKQQAQSISTKNK